MSQRNKIKYNLRNVHYAKQIAGSSGQVTFATPVAWPGAVSLSLDAQDAAVDFYADGYDYFFTKLNNGYEGDFESALIPESFKIDIMGLTEDDNGVTIETGDEKPANFALLFQFDGDVTNVKHILYNCSMSRPAIAGQTIEEQAEPQTETGTLTAKKLAGVGVHAYADDASAAYATWESAVYIPQVTP